MRCSRRRDSTCRRSPAASSWSWIRDLARADSTVPVETRLVRINYAQASALVPAVSSIVTKSRGQVVADTVNNALVITDVQTRINDVESFVRGLDIRTPQVSIQAKIILVDRTDVEELGLQYDLGSTTQFFNKLVARPDPATAKPVDTNLDGVPDECQSPPVPALSASGGLLLAALLLLTGAAALRRGAHRHRV